MSTETSVPALTVNPYQTVWTEGKKVQLGIVGSPASVVASTVLRLLTVKEPVSAWALAKLSLAGAAAQAGAAPTTANAVAAATAVAAPSNRRDGRDLIAFSSRKNSPGLLAEGRQQTLPVTA
ncbi:MAG TPA: hypothetical protein VLJ59_03290 [Mycobacteriales bacterium]|nr:hypothetical protein [Mycobacteriales bacterium]